MRWLGNPGQLRPRNLDPAPRLPNTNDLSSSDRGLEAEQTLHRGLPSLLEIAALRHMTPMSPRPAGLARRWPRQMSSHSERAERSKRA